MSRCDQSPRRGEDFLKKLTRWALALTVATGPGWASTQQLTSVPYIDSSGETQSVDALISLPNANPNKKAVLLLHGAGGFKSGTTSQYAVLLASSGYVTLELQMFEGRPENPQKHLAQVFGAINFLATRNDVDQHEVSILGQSYGGALAIYSATTWANKKYNPKNIPVRSIAALYPTCFFHHDLALGKERVTKRMAMFGFPKDFYGAWIGTPIKILIGGEDDYEGRDSNSCNRFVESIGDPTQRAKISIQLFENATHGWDHGRTYSFRDPLACKWSGCENTNRSDPIVTELGKASILKFFSNP